MPTFLYQWILIFLTVGVSYSSLAQCSIFSGLPPEPKIFNTGTNQKGGTLPKGNADLRWKVSVGSYTGPYVAATVCEPHPTYYKSPWTDCAWISHSKDAYHTGNVDFFYKADFELPCTNLCHRSFTRDSTFCLNLDFFVDNSVFEIFVNGVPQSKDLKVIPVSNPYYHNGFHQGGNISTSLCKNWKTGNNSLVIQVSSGGGYAGFLAQASVIERPPPSIKASKTICQGEVYTFGTQKLSITGSYLEKFIPFEGCDSLVTMNLTVLPRKYTIIDTTLCQSELPFLKYSKTGRYVDTLKTITGCDSIRTLNLKINELPHITFDEKAVYCKGKTTELKPIYTPDNLPITYLWSNGEQTPILPITQEGKYEVTVKNGKCSTKAQTIITQDDPPILRPDEILCVNSTHLAELRAGANGKNMTYFWSPTPSSDSTLLINKEGIYEVLVRSSKGCEAKRKITVSENPKLPQNQRFCLNSSPLKLTAEAVGENLSFLWTPSNSTDSTLTVSKPADYTISAKTIYGCENKRTISVIEGVINPLKADEIICLNSESVLLEAGTTGTGLTYLWTPSNTTESTLNVSKPGNYKVVVKSASGCEIKRTLNVSEIPNLKPDAKICTNLSKIELNSGAIGNNLSYSWKPSQANTPTIEVSQTGNYEVKVKNTNGCEATRKINLSLGDSSPTIKNDESFCLTTSTLQLESGATGNNLSYYWTPSNSTQATLSISEPGIYQIKVKSVTGCEASRRIIVQEAPQLDAKPESLCLSQKSVLLKPEVIGSNLSYLWTPTSKKEGFLYAEESGEYELLVQSRSGCQVKKKYTVMESPKIRGTDRFCLTSTLDIKPQITGAVRYLWSPTQETTPTLTVTKAGEYELKATSLNGCQASSLFYVSLTPKLKSDEILCLNSDKILLESGSEEPNLSYHWMPTNTYNSTLETSGQGEYEIEVANKGGCAVKRKITLDGIPKLGLPSSINLCESSTLELKSILFEKQKFTYKWSTGEITPSIKVNKEGNYSLEVSNKNCSTQEKILVVQKPNPNIEPDVIQCREKPLIATPTANNLLFLWNPLNAKTNEIKVKDDGIYTVKITNPWGCSKVRKFTISGSCNASIVTPNIFTPDENSINDGFKITINGGKVLSLEIYNRWGELIYYSETETYWDGKNKGIWCPSEGYVYKIKYLNFIDNAIYEKSGVVILMR